MFGFRNREAGRPPFPKPSGHVTSDADPGLTATPTSSCSTRSDAAWGLPSTQGDSFRWIVARKDKASHFLQPFPAPDSKIGEMSFSSCSKVPKPALVLRCPPPSITIRGISRCAASSFPFARGT